MMDKVAYVCASKHAGNYCVTVSVDAVEFLQPVEVGEVVSLHPMDTVAVRFRRGIFLIALDRLEAADVEDAD